MAENSRKSLGDWGESQAAAFLLKKGYSIKKKNYRKGRGELDIIAETGDTLVFVEVKTASSDTMGPPQSWVTPQKQQQIGRVAQEYLYEIDADDIECRFDVIGVKKVGSTAKIIHIENAFWLKANL